jgi:glutamine amidotransferase
VLVIIDYGAGNLPNVERAVRSLGHPVTVTSDPDRVRRAEGVILPGVGAAADTMQSLDRLGLAEAVREYVRTGRPYLGVCMGLQALMSGSEEGGWHACLGIIPGRVQRLPGPFKVPQIGWNTVRQERRHSILASIPDEAYFYFVHSYYVTPDDAGTVAGTTDYGVRFPSVLIQDNVIGTQFHPEKSGTLGLRLYENFIALAAPAGGRARA